MTTLLKIINNSHKNSTEKVQEVQKHLNDNKEIVINKQLFELTVFNSFSHNGDFINGREEMI